MVEIRDKLKKKTQTYYGKLSRLQKLQNSVLRVVSLITSTLQIFICSKITIQILGEGKKYV